jgi:hypothetical protein
LGQHLYKYIIIIISLLFLLGCSKDIDEVQIDSILPTRESETVASIYIPLVSNGDPVRGWARAYSDLSSTERNLLGIEWYYDYELRIPESYKYVPFFWCDIYPALKYDNPAIIYMDKLKILANTGYSSYLLFINEPDLAGSTVDGGQCERTPRQAAYMLRAVRNVCPNCIIIGPTVSDQDYLVGWRWLNTFYSVLATPEFADVKKPEIAGLHTYLSEPPQLIVDSFFSLLSRFPGSPKKVWITEFATNDPHKLQEMIDYYRQDSRIERYAWFTARSWKTETNLITPSGVLTELGIIYSR